jgi:Domain of unknown function (DUF6379)
MFEKYMIHENDVQNVVENGKITGFQFGAKLPYYRGLGLSMVEDIQIKINGKSVKPDKISLTVHGNTYTLAELENEAEDRWEMGEVAHITVNKTGGLAKGEHKLNLMLNLRISYLPFPAIRHAEKIIQAP